MQALECILQRFVGAHGKGIEAALTHVRQLVAQYIAHDLQITVSSLEKLHQVEATAEAMGRRATVHLKIDTGMQRIGVHAWSAGPFIEAAVASRWIDLAGIFSHLACADEPDSPMTALQLERFDEACAHFTRIGAPMPPRGASSRRTAWTCATSRSSTTSSTR